MIILLTELSIHDAFFYYDGALFTPTFRGHIVYVTSLDPYLLSHLFAKRGGLTEYDAYVVAAVHIFGVRGGFVDDSTWDDVTVYDVYVVAVVHVCGVRGGGADGRAVPGMGGPSEHGELPAVRPPRHPARPGQQECATR